VNIYEHWQLSMMMNALINDNQEIIRKHLSEISRSNRTYYYIDNKVYGCIYEIAEKEGRPDLIPKDNETLSEWRERPGIPIEYLELETHLNNLFTNRQKDLFKQKTTEDKKDENVISEPPPVNVYSQPSIAENEVHETQVEPTPDKYEARCLIILLFLLFIGPVILLGVFFEIVKAESMAVAVMIVVCYFIFVMAIRFWMHEKGYLKFPTKEQIEAEKEERMRKWGGPIKSAHIIRLERGLYTGLGNRRPYPHGRRTKKY